MVKLALAIAISLWSMQAHAEDWQVFATTKLGILRMDRESVTSAGKYTKAVISYKFDELQKVAKPPYEVFNRRQDDIAVDCARLELGVVARRLYEDDKLASSYELAMTDVSFIPSSPDTMVETVINTVCAAVPVSKP